MTQNDLITRAISIRQPYVEAILDGKKTIEYRSRSTNIRERVYLYASDARIEPSICEEFGYSLKDCATGLILGSVEITNCRYDAVSGLYCYDLKNPERFEDPLKTINQAQPCFWKPVFKSDLPQFNDIEIENDEPLEAHVSATINIDGVTRYHARLFAEELSREYPSDSVDSLVRVIMNSTVTLNPHQLDAALFAFRSPLSRGAILADEVGLGKTIEAGLVLAQKWAERRRKILIIVPSSLRKQWQSELAEKFYLPSLILESGNFNSEIKSGNLNPFAQKQIIICSYNFASNKAPYFAQIQWDLVVIDEAHRLRNVYKNSNKIARAIRDSLENTNKLLLTATPLQNSLLELFGLVSIVDNQTFGDIDSFKEQYCNIHDEAMYEQLKSRLAPVTKRTLRRQVLLYIKYTQRHAYTQEFTPHDPEQQLYDLVSTYLQRPSLYALPCSQRNLIVLVMRKLLASSTFAIAGALESLISRLEGRIGGTESLVESVREDYEAYTTIVDEQEDDEPDAKGENDEENAKIGDEIRELRDFYDRAVSIKTNAKGEALLVALEKAFAEAVKLGGAAKAIVFTESRRTQHYLWQLLSENGYRDRIVLFNGQNENQTSRQIYNEWKLRHAQSDVVSGSRSADTRAALVEYFRDTAQIMIATEAAAEGINLQFCSLVVNYDLPWNPQRIEQRIGRCHRYGQKNDVVVVNFLNRNNQADQRVFELLDQKFRLFSGVFGASDEVLGTIGSGIDFEKRIVEIYQSCRSTSEIDESFAALQRELSGELDETMKATRRQLLENFDTEVAEKLNIFDAQSNESLNRQEVILWELARYQLGPDVPFDSDQLVFSLQNAPSDDIPCGTYSLKFLELHHHFRPHNPLAQYIINSLKQDKPPRARLNFRYTESAANISILKNLCGQKGRLRVHKLIVKAFEREEHLLLCGVTDGGKRIDAEQSARLFNLGADVTGYAGTSSDLDAMLDQFYQDQRVRLCDEIEKKNAAFFEEEMQKLELWSEDKKRSLELTIRTLDIEIKTLKTESRKALTLDEKVSLQRKATELEKKRNELRKTLYSEQDRIDNDKDSLLDSIEGRKHQRLEEELLFEIEWSLV